MIKGLSYLQTPISSTGSDLSPKLYFRLQQWVRTSVVITLQEEERGTGSVSSSARAMAVIKISSQLYRRPKYKVHYSKCARGTKQRKCIRKGRHTK